MSKKISRRAIVACVAVVPALTAGASTAHPDAELIDAAERLIALSGQYAVAADRAALLNEECAERLPERPAVLRHRGSGDVVGATTEELGKGKFRYWCDPAEIEQMRGTPIARVGDFVGTDADQKRFNEILIAHDQYSAAQRELMDRLGVQAAEAVVEKISVQVDEVTERIAVTPARTLEGIRAKARAMLAWFYDGDQDLWNAEAGNDFANKILQSIVGDLIRSTG